LLKTKKKKKSSAKVVPNNQ